VIGLAGTIYAAWLAFQSINLSPANSVDPWILVSLAAGYIFAVAVILVFNDGFSFANLGQIGTYFGEIVFFGTIGGGRLGWWNEKDDPITVGEINLSRACFVVGVVCLVMGLLIWIRKRFSHPALAMEVST
jgi:hypothetical protein